MFKYVADWLTFDVLSLGVETELGKGVNFFIDDSLKILLLLFLMTHLMSLVRYYLPIEKLRYFLTKRRHYGLDYLLASVFGAVTPFCSCSSIPLFIGLVGAGIPLGVTFSFLITSPLVNEVAVALFIGLFGWKITLLYVLSGVALGVGGGYIIGRLKMEGYVESFLVSSSNKVVERTEKAAVAQVLKEVAREAWGIFHQVVWYVLLGIGIGAAIHGFVPEGFLEDYVRVDNPLAVPLAVLVGIPLYANAQGVIPIVQSLVAKGVPLGTALAFMMATVGLSLPEALVLKRVIKLPLLLTFFGVVALGMVAIGYIFNGIIG